MRCVIFAVGKTKKSLELLKMCALCNQRRLRYVNAKFRVRDPLNSPHQRFNNRGSTVNNSRQKIDDTAVERALVELGVEPGPLPGLCEGSTFSANRHALQLRGLNKARVD